MRLVQAGHDERNLYSGGIAGDQTTKEVGIVSWFNYPWDMVLRPKNSLLAITFPNMAELIAALPQVGYDQSERMTLWAECDRIKFNPTRINEIGFCECDCSSFLAVCLRFVGVEIPKNSYTGSIENNLLATGYFEKLTGTICENPEELKRGDILLNTLHHVAIAIDTGKETERKKDDFYGIVTVSDYLQVRTEPRKRSNINEFIIDDGTSFRLPPNMEIHIVETYGKWGKLANIDGWVFLSYIKRLDK